MPQQGQMAPNKQQQEEVFVHDDELTCLTKDFIVQASDRRLTYRRGRKTLFKEDDRNKALIYENHTVFLYTGLATLSNQKFAIDWAAELLATPPTLHDAMAYLLTWTLSGTVL
jgi:hypothetical protein